MNAMNPQKTNDSKAVLNLGLNDGTYMPQACLDVLKSYSSRTDLRNYTTADNDPLREAIAEKMVFDPIKFSCGVVLATS